MKKIFTVILLGCILLSSCGAKQLSPEETTPETTVLETTEKVKLDVKYIPRPYIDIEFTENGLYDEMNHMECSIEDESKGRVVNEPISINGVEYTVPHLYVEKEGGVARLLYTKFESGSDLRDMLVNGFTLEALVLNTNKFNSSSSEQCLTSSCQGGGYNFTILNGRYKFSVHIDGKYRTPQYSEEIDPVNMTHLVGIYNPETQTASLYVNGVKAEDVAAIGNLAVASGTAWNSIILGGDISTDDAIQILSSNTRIADFKLYPYVLDPEEVETAYRLMLGKFTGIDLDFEIDYYVDK